MKIKANTWYFCWYECRLAIILTDNEAWGFWAHGQDAHWQMDCAEIICEVGIMDEVKREWNLCVKDKTLNYNRKEDKFPHP